jgi:hypothetical protein
MDGERVHASLELIEKRFIDHAMTLDSGLSLEGICHDMDVEMSLAARPVARMPLMEMGIISHLEACRGKGRSQFLRDQIACAHCLRIRAGNRPVNRRAGRVVRRNQNGPQPFRDKMCARPLSSLECDQALRAY